MKKIELDNYYQIIKNNSTKFDLQILKLIIPISLIQKNQFNGISYLLDKKYSLSPSQANLITMLYLNKQALTPTQLTERLIFSSGGMTKLLKSLEAKELIKRIMSNQDKRSVLVEITEKGKNLCHEIIPDLLEIDNKIFSNLDKTEKELLEKILKKVVYNILA